MLTTFETHSMHISFSLFWFYPKGALWGLKKVKKVFYFTLIALHVLKIFKFLSWLFGDLEKRFDWKNKVNFKLCDVTTGEGNNCNTYIVQTDNQTTKFGQLIEYHMRIILLEKLYAKCGWDTISISFLDN